MSRCRASGSLPMQQVHQLLDVTQRLLVACNEQGHGKDNSDGADLQCGRDPLVPSLWPHGIAGQIDGDSASALSTASKHAPEGCLLLTMTVDLGNGTCDVIYVYDSDDAVALATAFVHRNELPQAFIRPLACEIRRHLQEAVGPVPPDDHHQHNERGSRHTGSVPFSTGRITNRVPQRFEPIPKISDNSRRIMQRKAPQVEPVWERLQQRSVCGIAQNVAQRSHKRTRYALKEMDPL